MGKLIKLLFCFLPTGIIVVVQLVISVSCSENLQQTDKGLGTNNKSIKVDAGIKVIAQAESLNETLTKNKNRLNNDVVFLEMLLVSGGTFTMGLDHPKAIADERSEHQVTLAPFLLDKNEVTNSDYFECVKAGVCRKPKRLKNSKGVFSSQAEFRVPNKPISSVSQADASTYCAWRNKRLPTEAEFERAARGSDNRMYAWGNVEPNDELAVFGQKVTAAVGSKPKGAGPYGHLDLAGNVWEWTSDLYDPYAYTRKTASKGEPGSCAQIKRTQDELRKKGAHGFTGKNPIPKECEHVLRGGAFNYFSWGLRAANRVHHPGTWRMIMAGFRCAKDQ